MSAPVRRDRPIGVLLADDEPLIRAGLRMLIDTEDDLVVVGEADDGQRAVELAAHTRPDVVVMDVRMPRVNGIEATRHLVGEEFLEGDGFAVAVLILTTFHEDGAVHDALRAGASGFLLKNAAPRWLGDAIRSVAAGDAWLDPTVARRLLSDFVARPASTLPATAALDRLTVREREVLTLVAHGMPNTAIAEHLVISVATVRTHVGRVMTKLGLRDRSQVVTAAYRTGLVHPQDPPPPRLANPPQRDQLYVS